jgi:2-dehydro-3-deoxyphosphogalactonate aldolase
VVDHRLAFLRALEACPLVAILRGINPNNILKVADTLVEAGIKIIEVPLNSPEPFESISLLLEAYPDGIVVGAGTVITNSDAEKLAQLNAGLLVTPNTNPLVISIANEAGMASVSGCLTPTEAIEALSAGSTALKIFPANALNSRYAKDIKAVLPGSPRLIAVGGIAPENLEMYKTGGYDGFGVGSHLYKPGRSVEEIAQIARDFVQVCANTDFKLTKIDNEH